MAQVVADAPRRHRNQDAVEHAELLGRPPVGARLRGVLAGAFTIQFAMGEFPCPLCMLQRYGMILSTSGALFIIMQARRGTLTPTRYMQDSAWCHRRTGRRPRVHAADPATHPAGRRGYGEPVMGLHLYHGHSSRSSPCGLRGTVSMVAPAVSRSRPAPVSHAPSRR
jgi:hypothetical protein